MTVVAADVEVVAVVVRLHPQTGRLPGDKNQKSESDPENIQSMNSHRVTGYENFINSFLSRESCQGDKDVTAYFYFCQFLLISTAIPKSLQFPPVSDRPFLQWP